MTKNGEDISALGFEEAMKELEKIVRDLESGQVRLDDAGTLQGSGTSHQPPSHT